MMTGGNPLGAGAGVLARRVAAPYAADARANLAGGIAGGANTVAEASPVAAGALGQWFAAKGVRMDQPPPTPEQAAASSRGNLTGKAAEELLQTDPNALGRWAPEFAKAAQTGSIDQLIVKLVQNDPEFRTGPYLRLQSMTAPGGAR
jgi:type IV secretory pathway TrbL component